MSNQSHPQLFNKSKTLYEACKLRKLRHTQWSHTARFKAPVQWWEDHWNRKCKRSFFRFATVS